MVEKFIIKDNFIQKNENGNILYFINPAENEKNYIINDLMIDSHSLISALDPDEVGRFEIEKEFIVLIWKIPNALKINEFHTFNILSIGFFIKNDLLIIISSENIQFFNELKQIKLNNLYDLILYFLNITTRQFIEHLKVIKLISREIQEKINLSMENEYLIQMFNLSEILIFYLDAISGNKIVLEKFKSYVSLKNLNVNILFLDDIIIENEQSRKQAEIYSQIFAGLMDARGTIVNNNMNILIKNLTVINIIFLPLNLIASIGGMSEYSSFTKDIPWPISYGIFSIAMIIIGYITLKIINKYGNISNKLLKNKSNLKK